MWCESRFCNENRVPIHVKYIDGTEDTIYPSPKDPNTNFCLLQITNQQFFEPHITCPLDQPYTSICPVAIAIKPISNYDPRHPFSLEGIFTRYSPWVIKDIKDGPNMEWTSLLTNSISPEDLKRLLAENNNVRLLIAAKTLQILRLSQYPFPNSQM